jgi:uncharacterized protein
MLTLFPDALPVQGFLGGLMIGLASAMMLLGVGRVAGISGMAARAVGLAQGKGSVWISVAFIVGLPLGALVVSLLISPVEVTFPSSIWPMIIGGLLVGYGTRLGSGCTSGHGVCGLSRLSPRSMAATAIFMGSGFMTVSVLRLLGLLS